MSSPNSPKGKHRDEAHEGEDKEETDSEVSEDDILEEFSDEYLEILLEQAKAFSSNPLSQTSEHDVLVLDSDPKPLPPLNPGPTLPGLYFTFPSEKTAGPSLIRDPDVEKVLNKPASLPSKPPAPPELSKSGKPLTKREKKELRNRTAGPDWFDLPAPAPADLPRFYREVEALRLRNTLDPKRFYRRDEGEGKGIAGLPKHFAIGTIVQTKTPFGTPTADNLTRAERKRTIVDELVDDMESRRYAKRKFEDLQTVRGERGRGTYAKKFASRKQKW